MSELLSVTFTGEGLSGVEHRLLLAIEAADQLEEPFGHIAGVVKKKLGRAFAAQGPGWAPLSPKYASSKAKHFPGKPILQRTGQMKADVLGAEPKITGSEMSIAVPSTPYSYHQYGTSKMPKRQIAQFSASDERQYVQEIARYLTREIEGL